jgi:hypothetical protein
MEMMKMSKFRLEDYEGKYAMHVKTEEEYNAFCEFLDSEGETWNIDQSYMKIRHWDKYTKDTCLSFNEGSYCTVTYFKDHGYTILEFSDFDWSKKEEKEMKEFKVGDKVKCIMKEEFRDDIKTFINSESNIHEICKIPLDYPNCYLLKGCPDFWHDYELELVCEFKKGQEVEASDNGEWLDRYFGKKFYDYNPEIEKPFLTIDEDGDIHNWKYCRAIQPKYEAYTEPKVEWIGKDIVHKRDKNMVRYIDSIVRDEYDENVFAISTDLGTEYNCKQLFKDWNWADGSIIGKEIK